MKKENKNIVINKDNYKGYVELYEIHRSGLEFHIDEKLILMFVKLLTAVLFTLILVLFFTILNPIVAKMLMDLGCAILLVGEVATIGICIKDYVFATKKKYKEIKSNYPYVDIHISKESLEKSLEEVGIVKHEHKNGLYFTILQIEKYENYLKMEEIKENYLEETKYDKYVVSPRIEEQELEKVKVKVKSLTR